VILGEMIDNGKVIQRGTGSRAVPLSKTMARLLGGVEIGDYFEWKCEDGRYYIVFPGKTPEKSKSKPDKPVKPKEDTF